MLAKLAHLNIVSNGTRMEFVNFAIGLISSDPHVAVKGLLLIMVGSLGFALWKVFQASREDKKALLEERNELIKSFQRQLDDDRKELIDVIEKYQQGQFNVVQAMNEIRVLIATIGVKL